MNEKHDNAKKAMNECLDDIIKHCEKLKNNFTKQIENAQNNKKNILNNKSQKWQQFIHSLPVLFCFYTSVCRV